MAHVAHYKMSGVHQMLGHYERRAELEHGYRRENIDPSRTPRNYAIGASSPQELAAAVRARVLEARQQTEDDSGRRLRKDANVLSDLVVTLPRDCPKDRSRDFFACAVRFAQARYGRENVLGGFVHEDEATPHVHIPVVPVRDGRIRAARVFTRVDLRTLHKDLGRAEDEALGMHVSVELDPSDKGARQLSHLGQDEYRAAKDELRRTRAEAEGWARVSRALGPTGDGADVPQEDGSVRHQDSVGQLVTQRETMRAEAEMQLELARQARQQAETELSEARQEASQARAEAKRAREDAEAAKGAQRAAEGARAAVQRDVAALEGQRAATKRLAAEEYQRHLRATSDNLLAEAAQTLRREEGPAVTRDGLEGVWRDFSRAVADVALDWWRDARDYARELWRSWRHGEWGGRTADRLGIDRRDAGGMADEALEDAGVERGEAEAAADLLTVQLAPRDEYRRGL